MNIIDADWTPTIQDWESPTRISDPVRYSARCARIRRRQARVRQERDKALLLGSLAVLACALGLAVALLL